MAAEIRALLASAGFPNFGIFKDKCYDSAQFEHFDHKMAIPRIRSADQFIAGYTCFAGLLYVLTQET